MRIVYIAEAIVRLETHAGGLAECELHEDVLRYYGIVKNIEIIGEAARMLTDEFNGTSRSGVEEYIRNEKLLSPRILQC